MDTTKYTAHQFVGLPIGTRFLYREEFWVKLAGDAAQNDSPESPKYQRVHYFSPLACVYTA